MTSSASAEAAASALAPASRRPLPTRRAVRKPSAPRRRHARANSSGSAVFAPSEAPPGAADDELGAKRGDRVLLHYGEVMSAVTRDLRITGVTKRGSSWQYHIEALDIRANGSTLLPPTLSAGTPPSTPPPSSTDTASQLETSVSQRSGVGFYPELPPMVRYTVLRRYNDFRQLYVYLVDTFGAGVRDMLPEFPDNGWLSFIRGDDPKLLQFRREQLQAFLRAVDAHDVLKWCDAFTHFLRPDVSEMTTIGGAFKQTLEQTSEQDEAMVSLNNLSVGRVNSSGGYVSLSYLKSPEIRFSHKQQPPKSAPVLRSDARGDSKRRRVALANLYEDPNRSKRKGSVAASVDRLSKAADAALNAGSTTASGDSVDSDSDEDDGDSSSFGSRGLVSLRQQTELLRLLSLDPPAGDHK